jgi:hypothetical protein
VSFFHDPLPCGERGNCCLRVGMVDSPSAATGTVMRPSRLRSYAREAGFADIEILPVENDSWRFYWLV